MYWQSLNEFFVMDGHGLYVWMCLLLVVIVVVVELYQLRVGQKQIRQRIQRAARQRRDHD